MAFDHHALLGTELPIIQAPMAGVQASRLALAVAAAGGLGSLPAAMLGPDALKAELQALKAGTRGPVNVNFFCHAPPLADAERDARWRERLRPHYQAYGIDPAALPPGAARRPFDDALAEVVEPFAPPIVSFHFGLPRRELVERVKRWGAQVWSSATTVAEARWLEANGADAVIAQGLEAGGHRGHFLDHDLTLQSGLFALLPQIVDAVRLPVIGAGGIADARGVRAALALGATAVQVGTAYLCCPEADTSALHRAALASDAARHTAVTNVFTGRPARGIVNTAVRALGPLAPDAPPFPLASQAMAPLRAAAERQGSADWSPLWAGQNASGCRAVAAGQLTRDLAELR
jgi:nitronate monooxygenase